MRSLPTTAVNRNLGVLFRSIDTAGGSRRMVSVTIVLKSNMMLTISAGAGSRSAPMVPPFTTYQVETDHEVPKTWRGYGAIDDPILYQFVPRLLITHHIVQSGGVRCADLEVAPQGLDCLHQ